MNTTASFPPVDDIISCFSQVEWRKHWRNFVLIIATVCAICVAVSAYIARHLRSWYQSGGKNDLLLFTLKLRKICGVCYTWALNVVYPQIIELYQDAVTVVKVAQGHLR